MEVGDVPLPDLCTALSSSSYPPQVMLLSQTSYSYVFILGDISVFAGLKFGEQRSPIF